MSDFIGSYEKVALLGYGGFGNVFKVTKGNKSYALKQIWDIDEQALREAKILNMVRHNSIVTQHESFQFEDNLCIVMEYADRGTLTTFVLSKWSEGIGNEYNVWRVLDNLSDALCYLHTFRPNPIIHCDLKPDNVLIFTGVSDMETGTKIHLKLADFGVAKFLNQREKKKFYTDSQAGTPIYMAPEVVKKQPFTFSADMWSLGAIMSFYCNGAQHLFRTAESVLNWKPNKNTLPFHYSTSLKSLVMSLLEVNPGSRPTAGKVNTECTKIRTERGMHNGKD